MNIQNWKLFNKAGSPLNWSPDPLIPLVFTSSMGKDAAGFLVTDPSKNAVSVEITNGGFGYSDEVQVSYTNAMNNTSADITADVSITYRDVSIFNPELQNVRSIESISIIDTIDASFVYPSSTFASAIFLEPISVGLVETEQIYVLEQLGNQLIRPYDASNYALVLELVGEDDEIQFFEVDEDQVEIEWTDVLVFDLSVNALNTPLQINIGFRAEQEGVYERVLRIYHLVGSTLYTIGEIVVNAEAIGEDERFRTLLANFGLPDPKDMKDVFKETDINEDLPDWEILNYKSKHMILEHDKIMPFVGTYKGLINAIKWLGYEDVYIREWFKNVKENKKLSFLVPYDADDRTQTILTFNTEQRKVLKKLNQLSLNYCITRETGVLDVWGTPETENCYSYNLKEVFIKLMGLKTWLEHNIIGINCRITDITGEGIYFERVQNKVYSTDIVGYKYDFYQSLTPYGIDHDSELIQGDASIRLTFLELTQTKVKDLPYKFKDFVKYVWNPSDPSTFYYLTDASYLADPSSFLLVGPTLQYPFIHLEDIMWRLSTEKDLAGVIGETMVTNPLLILENDIRFYNTFDSSSIFYDASTSLTIYIEKAYLRDPSLSDEWINSIAYTITPNSYLFADASSTKTLIKNGTYEIISGIGTIYTKNSSTAYNGGLTFVVSSSTAIITDTSTIISSPFGNGYVMESSSGNMWYFDEYVTLNPDTSSLLQYAVDDNYKVPLLSFKNYRTMDNEGFLVNFGIDKLYHLDILDGKIEINAGMLDPVNSSDNLILYINFQYDTSLEEQMITVNPVYSSPRMILYQIDPSVYYWADPSVLNGGNDPSIYVIDNSIYTMHVNHIGDYNIELFGWDEYNTLFYNPSRETYPVWIKSPTLYTLIDNSCNNVCVSTYMSVDEVSTLISDNRYPIYDRLIPLQGLSLEFDVDGNPYISVPSITYFQDVPEANSINRFYNLTERITNINLNQITIDDDYQKFYAGDDVRLIRFDKGKYQLIEEVSSHIVSITNPTEPVIADLDQIPASFVLEASTDIYILNDTYRTTENASNTGGYLTLDVVDASFEVGQLVGIIVSDSSKAGYQWGSSYRVTAVDGSTHTFEYTIPEFFVNDPKYTIQVKHAFSSYSDMIIKTEDANEVGNNFQIYLQDSYCQEYYLDSTFILVNVLFDQDLVNRQWYDVSDNLINDVFYYHSDPITVDISTLVILKAVYDPSNYLLNQKNIWTVINHDSSLVLFKVFNNSVPYIFNEVGTYDVECISYDSFGNAITKKYEGLIEVQ